MATFDVINLDKQKVGTVDLADEVFAAEVNEVLFWEVVKSQLASARAGTHAVKNRSLVSGGGRKPWKQKHTGRARAGSSRASHWVGGGKAMGPKPRDYSYRVPKKVRQGALRSALSLRAKEQKLVILDRWEPETAKTKAAAAALKKLGLGAPGSGGALIVDFARNEGLHRAVKNLTEASFLAVEGLNVYDILNHATLVTTKAAAERIGEALKP